MRENDMLFLQLYLSLASCFFLLSNSCPEVVFVILFLSIQGCFSLFCEIKKNDSIVCFGTFDIGYNYKGGGVGSVVFKKNDVAKS